MCTIRPLPATVVVAVLALAGSLHASKIFIDITGRRAACSNEGEPVVLDGEGMSCYPCICKNGFVECKEPVCPPVEDCYMLMPREGCCQRCKGCWINGTEHASHTEWSDASARLLRCEAGVLTVSRPECYVPCAHPVRTRHTHYDCPVCNDCTINGQHVVEGREVTIPEDPCLKCRCSKGGLTCAKRACAVLACPPHAQHTRPGECCPRCMHATAAKILPGHSSNKPCIMGKDYHAHLSTFSVDHCTTCSCVNGTAVCERKTCPVVTCDASVLLPPAPGKCCPRCPLVEEVKTACIVGGKTYQDGETWQWDACKSCECHAGEPRCAMERCPPLECAPDQLPRKIPGQCCAKCVDSDGVCTVFGDPHYKTFDGKFYSFQGSCKYQLVADCANDTFSIRISNDARNTAHSSWTRTVALRTGGTKINLGRRLRVKVDGRRVQLPYELAGGRALVTRSNGTVAVKTNIGVDLLWDGEGFLEVTVSSAYRNRLCGLCGNFNSMARDDLTSRDGRALSDPWRFGSSWRVGGKKACTRARERPARTRCGRRASRRAHRLCRGLEKLEAFSGCVAKLNPHNYRAACVRDACSCGAKGQCHCASYRAYSRECRRLGAEPGDGWSKAAWCEGVPPPWLREENARGGPGGGGGGGGATDMTQEQRLRMSVPLAAGTPQHAPRARPPPPNLQ